MSKRFSLDSRDFKRWGRNIVEMFLPSIIIYLQRYWDGELFTAKEFIVWVCIWALINLLRRFLEKTEYLQATNNEEKKEETPGWVSGWVMNGDDTWTYG